jgi:hypothetical protein
MGDKHGCSFCNQDLSGKQHIKIVFENWPVEETVIVRSRTGKERKAKRKTTHEAITAFGMECLNNPEKWKALDVFKMGSVTPEGMADLFEDIRWAGKNPTFILSPALSCLSAAICGQFRADLDGRCVNIIGPRQPQYRFDDYSCYVGHPGNYRIYNRNWNWKARASVLRDFCHSLKSIWSGLPTSNNVSFKKALTYFALVPAGALAGILLYGSYAFYAGVIVLKKLVLTVRGSG